MKGTALRTKRTLLNMAYALGSSLLLLLLGLVTRRLLVDNFGPQITTASQVVSQLFNFFSIAEFGVGSVISYRLYEQIAAKNEEKISKYMSMYKWAYRVVGLVIAGLAAEGYTTVDEIGYIQRGYEHFEKKLQGLGAVIEKVDSEKEAQKFRLKVG